MTCIVGLAHEGKVYIGGDSAGVDGRWALTVRADQKVFRNGEFIMGFSTSFRMGQLLAYALNPPRRHPDDDVYSYMVGDFIDAVRECLKKGGYATKKDEVETGGSFLVGYSGRLFHVEASFQVGESCSGFNACGCGDLIALGAMHVTASASPKPRILAALSAAEQLSAGVRGPFHVEQI